MNRIVHYMLDVDMRLSHEGLTAEAKEDGRDVATLKPGEFILFINHPFTAFKIFGSNNVFAYYRNVKGWALDPRSLVSMVNCFDGVSFDYKAALADEIKKKLDPELRKTIDRHRAKIEANVEVTKGGKTKAKKRRKAA